MKKHISAFFLAVCFTITSWAGSGNLLQPDPQIRLSGEVFTFSIYAEGSQYLNDEWFPGTVRFFTGEEVSGQSLKYNGFLDELIWLSPGFIQVQLDKHMIRSFTIKNPHTEVEYHFENITFRPWMENTRVNIFAQSLYREGISLMVYHRIRNAGQTTENVRGTIVSRGKLVPDPVYYILLPNGEARILRNFSRRSFLRVFPDHKDQIKRVFRQHGLRIRTRGDAVQAMPLINQVVSPGEL